MTYHPGKKIKDLRTSNHLTQREFAKRINDQFSTKLAHTTIAKWENGNGEPKAQTLRQIAIVYDVTLDSLLGLSPKNTTTNNDDNPQVMAAHHDGVDWTQEELDLLDRFKDFVLEQKRQRES